MGAGFHGGFGETYGVNRESSIDSNANSMISIYPLTKSGYFGEKGKNCRIILTDSPQVTSIDFYNRLSKGGKKIQLKNGKGTMALLGDGTRIVHRLITKTKDSPAIEITISSSSNIKNQKIHFVYKEHNYD